MYQLLVFSLMFVLPLLSIAAEATTASGADPVFLVGKWFVFWAAGVRLLVAGVSEIVRPEFAARGAFGIRDPKARKIVSELGYAHVSIGLLCMITLAVPEWVLPGALLGGTFHALAGVRHLARAPGSGSGKMAMVTDLAVSAILGLYVLLESL